MNIRKRAETFSRYVGLELKGRIISQQFTAKGVAEGIGRQPAAFNRWLNGKVEMPLTVFCEACEYIDVDPTRVVEGAYSRLAVEFGERDGQLFADDRESLVPGGDVVAGVPDATAAPSARGNVTHMRTRNVVTPADTIDYVETPDLDGLDYAASRGARKADEVPWAE